MSAVQLTSLGFRTGLDLLASQGSEIEEGPGYLVVRSPEQPAFYWGNCLILATPPYLGGAREVAALFDHEFPDARHRAVGIAVGQIDDDLKAEFEEVGLLFERTAVLSTRELKDPAYVNRECVIRPLETDDDWEQVLPLVVGPGRRRRDDWAFARQRAKAERRLSERGGGHRWGAWLGDTMVSTAALFMAGQTGEGKDLARFQNVMTLPKAQRQGLAGTLLHAIGSHGLRVMRADQLVICADPQGPAVKLYRSLGFTERGHEIEFTQAP